MIFLIPGIRSEADEASEDEEFDKFGFKVVVETKLVKLFRFHDFFYQISSNDGCLFISSANLLILLSKFQESVLKLTKLLKMKNLTNSVSKLMLKPNLLYCSDFLMSAVYDVYVLYAALIYFIF